ncbi:unnamed protein product [Cylicostephanus goldi]|uniref:Uncharacterized protein n=1 Tax=Cylicostephanus goldi TaxID=71465 RepID=A0A3P6QX11_CYLGO|nr:unnamed protein product [Cylicostephanus goldi]
MEHADIVKQMRESYDEKSRLHYLTLEDLAQLDDPASPTASQDGESCQECDDEPMSSNTDHQTLESHNINAVVAEEEHANEDDEAKEAKDIYYKCDSCQFSCFTRTVLETHMQPWRASMERDTKTVLIKTGMRPWNEKLFHFYRCNFDQTVANTSQENKENKTKIDCPAFIDVIEHEGGVLDCVAYFGHLGHEVEGMPPEEGAEVVSATVETKNKDEVPCQICGSIVPPEVDSVFCKKVKWCHCNNEECQSLAHEWCRRFMGSDCIKCKNGTLMMDEPL